MECRVCGELKTLEEFYKIAHNVNGRRKICKLCYNRQRSSNMANQRKVKMSVNYDELSLVNIQKVPTHTCITIHKDIQCSNTKDPICKTLKNMTSDRIEITKDILHRDINIISDRIEIPKVINKDILHPYINIPSNMIEIPRIQSKDILHPNINIKNSICNIQEKNIITSRIEIPREDIIKAENPIFSKQNSNSLNDTFSTGNSNIKQTYKFPEVISEKQIYRKKNVPTIIHEKQNINKSNTLTEKSIKISQGYTEVRMIDSSIKCKTIKSINKQDNVHLQNKKIINNYGYIPYIQPQINSHSEHINIKDKHHTLIPTKKISLDNYGSVVPQIYMDINTKCDKPNTSIIRDKTYKISNTSIEILTDKINNPDVTCIKSNIKSKSLIYGKSQEFILSDINIYTSLKPSIDISSAVILTNCSTDKRSHEQFCIEENTNIINSEINPILSVCQSEEDNLREKNLSLSEDLHIANTDICVEYNQQLTKSELIEDLHSYPPLALVTSQAQTEKSLRTLPLWGIAADMNVRSGCLRVQDSPAFRSADGRSEREGMLSSTTSLIETATSGQLDNQMNTISHSFIINNSTLKPEEDIENPELHDNNINKSKLKGYTVKSQINNKDATNIINLDKKYNTSRSIDDNPQFILQEDNAKKNVSSRFEIMELLPSNKDVSNKVMRYLRNVYPSDQTTSQSIIHPKLNIKNIINMISSVIINVDFKTYNFETGKYIKHKCPLNNNQLLISGNYN